MKIARELVVIALVGGIAAADPSANDLVKRAKSHFELQEYAAAEADLKEAYRLDPKPSILYALAQAQRMNNECDKAIISYRNFLRTNPPAEQEKLADENIARCEADLEAKPEPKPEPREPAPPPKPAPEMRGVPWTSDWAGHGLVATGIAATVLGTVLALDGQHTIDAINSAQFYDDFLTRSKDAADAERERTIGLAAAGVGGALVIAGIVTYVVRAPRAAPTVAVGRRGELLVGWSF